MYMYCVQSNMQRQPTRPYDYRRCASNLVYYCPIDNIVLALWTTVAPLVSVYVCVLLVCQYNACVFSWVQQSVTMAGFDPRLEDMSAVKQLYEVIFKPYISSASSWVSVVL